MRNVADRMRNGSPLLWWSGVACVVLTILFGVMALLDPTMITGVRRWIKPAKFCISFVFYFWTLAWMLPVLKLSKAYRRVIEISAVVIMAIELIAIATQAARGVTSHFNNSTVFDAAVYAIMGAAISTNTIALLLLALFATFAWKPVIHANAGDSDQSSIAHNAERAGIISGLWLVVVGSVFGILISVHGAHAVGVPEDANGLPLVGWKRAGGDLRVAHFLGLHGFQMAPLVASIVKNSAVVYVASVVWVLITCLLFRGAMTGTSVWPFPV